MSLCTFLPFPLCTKYQCRQFDFRQRLGISRCPHKCVWVSSMPFSLYVFSNITKPFSSKNIHNTILQRTHRKDSIWTWQWCYTECYNEVCISKAASDHSFFTIKGFSKYVLLINNRWDDIYIYNWVIAWPTFWSPFYYFNGDYTALQWKLTCNLFRCPLKKENVLVCNIIITLHHLQCVNKKDKRLSCHVHIYLLEKHCYSSQEKFFFC